MRGLGQYDNYRLQEDDLRCGSRGLGGQGKQA